MSEEFKRLTHIGSPEDNRWHVAQTNIRKRWIEQGIWMETWFVEPGLQWAHELPPEPELESKTDDGDEDGGGHAGPRFLFSQPALGPETKTTETTAERRGASTETRTTTGARAPA